MGLQLRRAGSPGDDLAHHTCTDGKACCSAIILCAIPCKKTGKELVQDKRHTKGLLEGVGNHVALAWNCLPIYLVGPASIVSQMLNGLHIN